MLEEILLLSLNLVTEKIYFIRFFKYYSSFLVNKYMQYDFRTSIKNIENH
jgi:hypothetical protein